MSVMEADELSVLHDRIRGCVACPLHIGRTQAVPGSGPVTARIMAVGEAPGENEDRMGQPFVGAAGQVLTKLLDLVGIPRGDLYITNVVKCRPPQNRDPMPSEVDTCSPHLDAQVALIKPEVILLLGRHALARVLPGSAGISRLHGERIRRGDRVYVPLYHPAAALYNGSLMQTLEEDMRKVRGYLDATRLYAATAATPAAVTAESATSATSAASASGDDAGDGDSAGSELQLTLF